jgi:hypothetical protein
MPDQGRPAVFLLYNLRSEKGTTINGRRCVVVGSDNTADEMDPLGIRIHVHIDHTLL